MLHKNQLKASAGIAMAVAALGAPAASAMPIDGPTVVRQDKQVVTSSPYAVGQVTHVVTSIPAARTAAPNAFSRQDKQVVTRTPASTPVASTPATPVATSGGGFDWADAGIGAAGGLVLSIAAFGTALVVIRRRPGASQTSAPVTS
jgi:hypothetical protein